MKKRFACGAVCAPPQSLTPVPVSGQQRMTRLRLPLRVSCSVFLRDGQRMDAAGAWKTVCDVAASPRVGHARDGVCTETASPEICSMAPRPFRFPRFMRVSAKSRCHPKAAKHLPDPRFRDEPKGTVTSCGLQVTGYRMPYRKTRTASGTGPQSRGPFKKPAPGMDRRNAAFGEKGTDGA